MTTRQTREVQSPIYYWYGLRFEHTRAFAYTKLGCCFGFRFGSRFGLALFSNDCKKKGNFQNPCLVAKFKWSMSEVCWKRRICASIVTICHTTFLMPCPRNMHSTCSCIHIKKHMNSNTSRQLAQWNRMHCHVCVHMQRKCVYISGDDRCICVHAGWNCQFDLDLNGIQKNPTKKTQLLTYIEFEDNRVMDSLPFFYSVFRGFIFLTRISTLFYVCANKNTKKI